MLLLLLFFLRRLPRPKASLPGLSTVCVWSCRPVTFGIENASTFKPYATCFLPFIEETNGARRRSRSGEQIFHSKQIQGLDSFTVKQEVARLTTLEQIHFKPKTCAILKKFT